MTKEYEHPSYGVVGVVRTTGNQDCFMSDGLNMGGYIKIVVKQASVERDLSNYWVHGKDLVLSLRMSYHQFSEMICNANVGDGVPCTLEYISPKGKGRVDKYESLPPTRIEFETELKTLLEEVRKNIEDFKEQIKVLSDKGKANKTELLELSRRLENLKVSLFANIPFIESCFTESINDTVSRAKVETSAWLEHKLYSMGIESIKNDLKLLEGKIDKQETED